VRRCSRSGGSLPGGIREYESFGHFPAKLSITKAVLQRDGACPLQGPEPSSHCYYPKNGDWRYVQCTNCGEGRRESQLNPVT
jgi:hypothetical protein